MFLKKIEIYTCVTYFSDDAFFCNDGIEIDRNKVCDGDRDCMEGEDEDAAMCGGTGSGGSGGKYLYDKSFVIQNRALLFGVVSLKNGQNGYATCCICFFDRIMA